jgi:hypothetical protein
LERIPLPLQGKYQRQLLVVIRTAKVEAEAEVEEEAEVVETVEADGAEDGIIKIKLLSLRPISTMIIVR